MPMKTCLVVLAFSPLLLLGAWFRAPEPSKATLDSKTSPRSARPPLSADTLAKRMLAQLAARGFVGSIEFEFESRLVDMMFGSFFEDICNSLVDAFTKRAAVVFGSRQARNK